MAQTIILSRPASSAPWGYAFCAAAISILRNDESRSQVAIVNEKLARSISPSGDVIGQHVRIGDLKSEVQVIGVAADATFDDPHTANAPAIYVSAFQRPDHLGWSAAIVRTPGRPAGLAHALRQRIEALGREYPLIIEPVDKELGRTLLPERTLSLLTTLFGLLALLLAVVGLYGLLSYTDRR